jgi:acetoin:2,6-dichlorophenolindophenol oxidoreductase subunit alpha
VNREYYRSKQEEQEWMSERDPIKMLSEWLLAGNLASAALLESLGAETKSRIDEAVKFAIAAPYPDPSEVQQDVYA